jgi:phage tail sheath protein FI
MAGVFAFNDASGAEWFAPAGLNRGGIGSVIRAEKRLSADDRDTLYDANINPINTVAQQGVTIQGQKTLQIEQSALDRINVRRLFLQIRRLVAAASQTLLFEPNDQITRNEFTNAVDGLMIDLVAKRGIYDYLVVCDLSNNTPARIDRNELYMDIAIEPVKAVEFIYIPVRLKNTGEIAAGQTATSAGV